MKVPINWLREYVEFDATTDELAARLTFSGTEVESIETVGSDHAGVVVGEILSVSPHPRADHLHLCRVDAGTKELEVVCGADNFGVGDKAPFAPVGVVLPDGTKIKTVEIKGVASRGMLCAEDELGISEDHSGIMLLDRELPPGTPFSEVIGPPEDVLELEVTWNRPDCQSIMGIAREVAAFFGTHVKVPAVDVADGEGVSDVGVTIEDQEGCPRYTAQVLSGVKLKPGPLWMRRRLILCGVRPINNIVDVTNYVMLECGQPLHAFDYNLVTGRQIVVRRARDGEKLATLDGTGRDISPEMLVIADAERPVAVAGVMGGAGSEIGDATDSVLLESARFRPELIKRTSEALGLSTESSQRFERGVDPGGVDWAGRRAADLMVEFGDAIRTGGMVDVFPGECEDRLVKCRFERVEGLLGVGIPPDETISILASLQLPMVARDNESCTVKVPSFRMDITMEADLIEEVARLHGLDNVPATIPSSRIDPVADDSATRAAMICRSNLVGLGLSEIMNYSFLSTELLDLLCGVDDGSRVILPNPVSSDYAVLRPSLLPHMALSLGRNLAHEVGRAALFEMGTVFRKSADGQISEDKRLSIGLMGPVGRLGLQGRKPTEPEEVFLWLKGILEVLCASQHIDNVELTPAERAGLEPGWSVSVALEGHEAGVLGLLGTDVRHNWRMSEPVGVAEISLALLVDGVFRPSVLQPIPVYPSVSRDMAFFVDESVRHEEISRTIWKTAPKELTSLELFDIFARRVGQATRRSLAYSLTYRSLERTLTDEEVNEFHESIKQALRKKLKAEIREG